MKKNQAIFWFRRDLRLEDNIGLNRALLESDSVLPIFIFDSSILDELPKNDSRVTFIHQLLGQINEQLKVHNSSLKCLDGNPAEIWKELIASEEFTHVYVNRDYEPYAQKRDHEIYELLKAAGKEFIGCKDQVIFEKSEIVKDDGNPYTVYTPYKNKWRARFQETGLPPKQTTNFSQFIQADFSFPSLADLGFEKSTIEVKSFSLTQLHNYAEERDIPARDSTSYLSPHLRFGTVSVRDIIRSIPADNITFVNELIWREFFMQILFHFPHVVNQNFKAKYNGVQWRNNETEFKKWCEGKTGYPMVDAGMRQLNETGYMHNRVRMITAGFLCKHLLIDWRWGEAYFAQKLLDYDLSANNGNWQWSAGTGCDAAPYFRIFNPTEQLKKFDKKLAYVRQWIPEFDSFDYPEPMVDHKFARERALATYQQGINQDS